MRRDVIKVKPEDHEKWLSEREKGIGASEVGAVVGLSPFETPFSIWLKKTGQVPREEENIAMKMGHLLEPVIVQLWEEQTGGKAVKASAPDILYIDPQNTWRRVTPDRIAWETRDDGKRSRCLLELKSTITDVSEDEIPDHWLCQVQYQMEVTGIPVCWLCWLSKGRYFGCVRIEHDAEFSTWLCDKVDRYWLDNVIGGVEPDPIAASDIIRPSEDGVTVEADSEAEEQLSELRATKDTIAELEAKSGLLTDKLKLFMREAEAIVSNGQVLATWKTGKRGRPFLLKKTKQEGR